MSSRPRELGKDRSIPWASLQPADAPGHGRHSSFQPAFSSAALSLVKIMRPALVCKTVVTTTVTVSPT